MAENLGDYRLEFTTELLEMMVRRDPRLDGRSIDVKSIKTDVSTLVKGVLERNGERRVLSCEVKDEVLRSLGERMKITPGWTVVAVLTGVKEELKRVLNQAEKRMKVCVQGQSKQVSESMPRKADPPKKTNAPAKVKVPKKADSLKKARRHADGIKSAAQGFKADEVKCGRAVRGETEKFTLDELIADVMRQKTPKKWSKMDWMARRKFRVCNRFGEYAVSRRFGMKEGNPVTNSRYHRLLGILIFGHDPALNEVKELTLKELRADVMRQRTVMDWIFMEGANRCKFRALGLGEDALATKYGTRHDPTNNFDFHLELGAKIYGCSVVELRRMIPERLKLEVRKKVQTFDAWKAMNRSARVNFEVLIFEERVLAAKPGKKVLLAKFKERALAAKLGVKCGDPTETKADHLKLGVEIW